MAETDPKMSGSQPVRTEGLMQQPQEEIQTEKMDQNEAVASSEGQIRDVTTSIPEVAAKSGVADAGTAATSSTKGKEKEGLPAAQKEDDSLSIEGSELPPAALSSSHPDYAPVCAITLLLPTGAKHPYKIDDRYLTKRNVEVPDVTESGKKDPFSISVYKLKELILREWRDEWEGKPASPSSIRLIHFGKLLDDKEQLKKYQLSASGPNVVHMSVRPAEMIEEDETAKGKSSGRDGRGSEGGGGCCIIL
ncbi:ubiquitin-related domain-containing protein [Diplogelasinospora grovesii]|uniref:Ubiquitin-related domain-containing protein n=1 Tax=Diplogelasinospora grovesii TaxID=303347 RepID=A0AAN6N7A9_9PEZI|nr:ubiquitin-related domain-containing protein [Diplogelasinospora grovesii]